MTSTQATRKTRGAGNSNTKADLPSSIVDDSHPDVQGAKEGSLNTSKLPGLTPMMSHDKVSSDLVIGTKGQGQSCAETSMELRAIGSSEDASVLVPSSLTPSSQQKKASGDNGGSSQLPNSGLISELFQSSKRRKKRGAHILDDDDGNDVVCIDDDRREKDGEREGEGRREEPAAKKKRTESASSMGATVSSEKGSVKGRSDTGGCGLFGGLQSQRKTNNKAERSDEAKISNGGSDAKNSHKATPLHVTGDKSGNKKSQHAEAETDKVHVSQKPADKSGEDKPSYRDRFSRPLDPVEQMPQVMSASSGPKDGVEAEHKTPKKTPKKSPTMSTSPFLSTRKQRRKSTLTENDNHPGEAGQASGRGGSECAPSSVTKSLFLDTPSTEHTATSVGTLTQTGGTSAVATGAKEKRLLTTPFTFLTTESSRKPTEAAAENTAVTGGGKALRVCARCS